MNAKDFFTKLRTAEALCRDGWHTADRSCGKRVADLLAPYTAIDGVDKLIKMAGAAEVTSSPRFIFPHLEEAISEFRGKVLIDDIEAAPEPSLPG